MTVQLNDALMNNWKLGTMEGRKEERVTIAGKAVKVCS